MEHRSLRSRQIWKSSCPRSSSAALPFARWWVFLVALAFLPVCNLALVNDVNAGFAGRFSLSLGEGFSDNIFFERNKEADFATVIRPTFSILYAPPGQTIPIFRADLSPEGQIFARNPQESNFGKNTTFNTEYTHYYSPLLTIYVRDTLERVGPVRSSGSGFERGSTQPPSGGGTGGPPSLHPFGDFVSFGNEVRNEISARGSYTYSPNLSFGGDYAFGFANYLDQGGSDIWHRVAARGVYRWRDEHNFHFGYGVDIIKTRDGANNIVHNIDIGDDYFSLLKLNLDPTLTIFASTGIGVVTGDGGVRLANNVNVRVEKLWQTASLMVGATKGITPSLGIAGVSDTTSLVTNFNIRFTERLSAYIDSNFSFYDTDDGNFKTFTAGTGIRYRILSWLSSELRYAHRWENDASSLNGSGDFFNPNQRGKINSNSIALFFTADFDVWPTTGFARSPAVP
jgi:hypothetical protein